MSIENKKQHSNLVLHKSGYKTFIEIYNHTFKDVSDLEGETDEITIKNIMDRWMWIAITIKKGLLLDVGRGFNPPFWEFMKSVRVINTLHGWLSITHNNVDYELKGLLEDENIELSTNSAIRSLNESLAQELKANSRVLVSED